jgi:hypothetical protein
LIGAEDDSNLPLVTFDRSIPACFSLFQLTDYFLEINMHLLIL